MDEGTDFYLRVFETACLIPYGKITTYGAIAKYVGSPGAARMVGWAMNRCSSYPKQVPAHRVVNRIGMLTGQLHFNPPGLMQELLENEGISVHNNKIIEFDTHFWDPSTELK